METNPPTGGTVNLGEIKRKQHYVGKVIKTILSGAIVDIGIGVPGVVHISQLQKDPVNRVEDVVQIGQEVEVWVRRVEIKKGRVDLTMIKPLELEWNEIKKDAELRGKVTRIEKFGIFVDIGAERPGLVHISEMTHDFIRTPGDLVKEGDEVAVKVLDVDRKKKQIRLSMKALTEKPEELVREIVGKAVQPRGSRPARAPREDKLQEAADANAEPPEPPVPTAMEMALRSAMERTQVRGTLAGKKKRKGAESDQELEKILSRTLRNRVAIK